MVKKVKLYYIDTVAFVVYLKIDDIYKDIAEDVDTRFDAWNYKLDRPFPKGKNKKLIGLMEDESRQAVKSWENLLFDKQKLIAT